MPINRRFTGFNRTFGNRVAGPMLVRMPGFGAIHHRGRKSGREYRTPVKVFRRGDTYAITLPYGSETDWVRNVIAAGGAELEAGGHLIPLTHPVIKADSGRSFVPAWARWTMSLLGAPEYIVLTRASSQEPR